MMEASLSGSLRLLCVSCSSETVITPHSSTTARATHVPSASPHRPSLSSTADSALWSSSTLPSLRTTYVAFAAFSSWESWRAARSSTCAWPLAAARR